MFEDNEVEDPAVARAACEAALDELTASLTQVMKSVTKVHRAVKRLAAAGNVETHPILSLINNNPE